MRLIISTIVVGLLLFILGGVVNMLLLPDFYREYFSHIQRSQDDMKLWAFGLANLATAFFMYIIYSRWYRGGSPFSEGLYFGLIISLFLTIPYVLFTWGGMPVTYTAMIVDGIISFIFIFLAGLVTALIHGKSNITTAKS